MEKALYLYCLAADALPAPDFQSVGLEPDAPVFVQEVRGVYAVISEIPLEDYCGASSESKLGDLNWVGPRAVRHQRIIEHAMTRSPVLPARFGTLFSTIDNLSLLIERNREKILHFFEWVRDRSEWAVKVKVSRAELRKRLLSQELSAQSAVLEGLSAGMRYFKEKNIKASIDANMTAKLRAVLTKSGQEFSDIAIASRKRDVVLRTSGEDNRETIASWAFLIDAGRQQELQDRVAAANLRDEEFCLSYEMTGPWPPYSFIPQLTLGAPE
jgi:hypothetical protein